MRKKIIIYLTFIFIIAITFSGCSNNKSNKIVLKLAEVHTTDHVTAKYDYVFADMVKEKTNGEIEVHIYPNAELGSEDEAYNEVRTGTIELARINTNIASKSSKTAAVIQFPYIFRDSEHMWKVLDSDIGMQIKEDLYKEGITFLSYYDAGARSIYTRNRQLQSSNDLNGLRIRVLNTPASMAYWSLFGVNPLPIDYNGVYSSLEAGTIDAAENNFSSYYTSEHYKVAKYLLKNEYMRSADMLVINKELFDSLTDSQKKAIEEAAKQASQMQRADWQASETEIENKIIKEGCIISIPSEEFQNEFKEKAELLYKSYPEYETEINMIKSIE